MLGLAHAQTAKEDNGGRIVLPNPQLLRCKVPECDHVWTEKSSEANAVFPKQVIMDMNHSCVYGMTALYDKSIALDDTRAAIDKRYGTWTVPGSANSTLRMWRVESEKFAIQLSVADMKDQERGVAEAGTKLAKYMAFGGMSACGIP